MARQDTQRREQQSRGRRTEPEGVNEQRELEDYGKQREGTQSRGRTFGRSEDEMEELGAEDEGRRSWSRRSQVGRLGEGGHANEFDEEDEVSSGGGRPRAGRGYRPQGYGGEERSREVLGRGMRSTQSGYGREPYTGEPSYGGAGGYGQQSYRGQGGDRSQSGGRQDYGGGYGAGLGQLGYGYPGGDMMGYGAGQGYESGYPSTHESRSAGRYRGRGPKGYRRSDERLTEDINERLTDHPEINAEDIEVSVQNGEVTLIGTVDDRHAKRMSEDVAWQVSGVTEVTNQLKIKRQNQTDGTSSTAGGNVGSTGKQKTS